ncbi:hypothetical protein CNMCM5793_000462 [Aspergillus hiratsukae]|uniref:Uncharacterized protein n=1 Tax=Aspergillus hiratsukae TaxID=1194566 RepID=A0A8H6P9Z3_9EURO|nr:hypothetical protein CNMCM5793_000462 [Aspergillus hiratsukae]KAF7161966.1 hypothetical protein CNMCM6106_009047 [Aspergillus hiratsukae]
MHRRAGELHQRGTGKLRQRGFHTGRGCEGVGDVRRKEGGDVEGGEDCDAVAQAEEGRWRGAGPKNPRKPRILIHTNPHIHSRSHEELNRAREDALKGLILQRGGHRIDRVGGEVSAPAVIALAMSTPRRMPSLSVFHFDEAEAEAEAVGAAEVAPMVTGTEPSGVRAFRGIICDCHSVDRVNSQAANKRDSMLTSWNNYADDSDCITDENAPGPILSASPPMPAAAAERHPVTEASF